MADPWVHKAMEILTRDLGLTMPHVMFGAEFTMLTMPHVMFGAEFTIHT